jgi:hypothetical protein
MPMELLRIIKMCFNKTHSKSHLSNSFPIQNGLKQGEALSSLLFNFNSEYIIRKGPKNSNRLAAAIVMLIYWIQINIP